MHDWHDGIHDSNLLSNIWSVILNKKIRGNYNEN